MRNELQQHKKSDKIKWIATALAVVMLGVGVTAAITKGFKDWNPYGWFDKKQEQPTDSTETPDSGGAVIGESTGNGVKLAARMLTSAEYDDYGVSPQAENAHTLTATVTPANATYKELEWSASWTDTLPWATDKTVSDYVTVTPSSDTLSAVVECKAPFAAQVQITVSYVHDSKINAACTVDYLQKYQNAFTGYIALDNTSGKKANFSSSADTRISIDFPFADNSELSRLGTKNGEISVTPQANDVYTIPMEYSLTKVEMLMSSAMSRAFSEYPAGFSTVTSSSSTPLADVTYKDGKCTGLMQKFMGITDYSSGNVSTVKSKLGGYSDCYYEYKIYFSVNGEEKSVSIRLSFTSSSIAIPVSNIGLSDGSIVF